MNFRVLPEAEGEAIAAALWYDDREPGLADEFFAEIEVAYASIMENPLGLARLEYGFEMNEVHRCLMHRFPYSVIYIAVQKKLSWLPSLIHDVSLCIG